MKPDIKAVILDLDQTLTIDTGSWAQFTHMLGADVSEHIKIYTNFRTGKIPYAEAKRQLVDLWKSVSVLDRRTVEDTFRKVKLRDGAQEAVEYLKKKYKLCIISGAIDVFVNLLSDRLGVEDRFAATRFIFDDNSVLTDFDYKLSRGEEKVGFLHTFCSKYGFKPADCAAIGDGESDMPIFKEVVYPLLFVAAETTEEQKGLVPQHLHSWQDVHRYL